MVARGLVPTVVRSRCTLQAYFGFEGFSCLGFGFWGLGVCGVGLKAFRVNASRTILPENEIRSKYGGCAL